MRRLRHEPRHHADVSLRAPGRLQDLLRQDDPGRRRSQETAAEVSGGHQNSLGADETHDPSSLGAIISHYIHIIVIDLKEGGAEQMRRPF